MDGDEEEGSDGEMEPEYSGMEQPPLTRMLKNILSEYPDDGQILKELIQNAEDAGASEVKILFDGRKVNQEAFNEKKKPFNKYFKGPALFFNNNAIFSDDDWRGIKMLYCSVKELDPLKVGRFGLGFKSVFHITDYPMVVSGKKLLVIDPYTTYSDKVCTSFLLQGLAKYRGMDMKAFRDAFDDIFGFGEETLRNGEYRGTLFRFPLRQIGTELSGNLYDKEKIESLFNSFTIEAPMTLLFLKNLEEMTLYRQNHGVEPSYSVKFKGQMSETALEKREFCNALRRFTGISMSHDLICNLHVNVSVETRSRQGLTTHEDKSWLIVNTVLGDSNMSSQLRALCQDEDLSYSPYVGIAIPYENIADFKGHVFCFLPLPLEERSLTGFPVHVNGFFALSQNRRHVKWPSADMKQSAINADKSLQWNQVLIKEALSQVYLTMVRELITKCTGANNPVDLVAMVYRSIPCLQAVDMKWRVILDPLVKNLLQTAFLYTENNGGQWIHHNVAVFEYPRYSTDAGVRDTLRHIMKQYKQNLTVIPPHVTTLLEEKTTMTLLTPAFLANLLRKNNWYENYSSGQKLHLLQYLMSDQQYSSLEGLELLPLANGSFVRFETYGCVYMCSETIMKLIPGCEEQIVKVCLPHIVVQHLQRIQKMGTFQIQDLAMDAHGFARLLHLCIECNLTDRCKFKVWDTAASSLPEDWLKNVWSRLSELSLEHFTNVHLAPEKHGKYYHLHSLSSLLIVESHKSYTLPEAVCRSMSRFSVIVLPALPFFVAEHPQVTNYIHIPTNDSFLRLLDRLYTNNNAYVQAFNDNADKSERISWRNYLEHFNIEEFGRTSLLRMEIFEEFQNDVYTSVSQVDMLAPQLGDTFPVKFPRRLLSSSDDCQYRLAQKLGASQLTEEAAIVEILSNRWHSYSDSDKKKLMLYFVENIHRFQRNHILMELAKEAKCIPNYRGDLRKPSELYNPSISQLRELVGDDSMFPARQFSSPEILFGLRNLGLKSSDPSRDLIITCIDNLDRKVKQGQSHTSNLEQAKAVNHFLSQQSELLKHYSLMDKKFLVPLQRTSSYPTALPWCPSTHQLCAPQECLLATTRNQRIVGSVIPLISEESYGYLRDACSLLYPKVTDVLEHLLQIKQNYTVKYNPNLMLCIDEVYNFLAEQPTSCIEGEIRDFFSLESLVWTGETFVEVNNVYTTRSPGDIPLEPYLYCLPREFISIKHFFEAVGCHETQTVEVLDIVQKNIKAKHDEQIPANDCKNNVGKDLNITVQILTIYKQDPESVAHLDVLFPVHTGSDTRLQLMSASECRYSNEEWLKVMAEEDEETIYYVHADIPPHTAQTLGVRSLTEGLLTDTEAIEPCGQHEDLTGRIKGLLDGYTDGLSVPKELVQNADDAGATKICFLYDERENMDSRTRLIDENMSGFQGPALWAYNDAQFTEADLRNITKLGGATKQEDDTKVGKFGLGFCSVYNLTDVPSFITGSDLIIFDPHYKNLGSAVKGKEPGIKINLKIVQNQRLVRRMKNQFKPFNGVFGCDMTMGEDFHVYDGTLFRLPLRTNEQAGKSEIKDTAYSQYNMKELLHMLMENGGNMLLFTQNVTKIEVYNLPANATDPSQSTLIYTATKSMVQSDSQSIQNSNTFNILKEVSALHSPVRHRQIHTHATQKSIQTDINIQVGKAAKRFTSCEVLDSGSCTRWIISYATGTSKSLEISKQTKGALPLAGVATPIQMNGCVIQLLSLDKMPFGFYKTGHYFCFLPLPIETRLPVHINATFAVAPDRRSIMWGTEDDRTELFKPRWNHSLMTDAVPNAYVSLLESLHIYNGISDKEYMNVWPIFLTFSDELQNMQKAFLTKIVEENQRVFKRHDLWAGFQGCKFMDPELHESDVGDIAYKAAIHFLESDNYDSAKVMRLQKDLDTSFSTAGLGSTIKNKIFSTENFFSDVLFPEIQSDFWESRERNMLVMFAVDNISETTKNLLQNSKCIPSEPTGALKYPHDLVHPESKLKDLFTTREGRFVHKEMIEAGIRERKEKQLADIGMIVDTLPRDLVLDRVESVLRLSMECDKCAIERSVNIINYIKEKWMCDTSLIEHLKDIPYLPILQKPKEWTFPWKADSQYLEKCFPAMRNEKVSKCNHVAKENVQFAKPRSLYLNSTHHLVGSQELVMDMSCYKILVSPTFNISDLGVNGEKHEDIPINVVCRHLVQLCEAIGPATLAEDSKHLLKKICNVVYTFLNKRIANETISKEEQSCIDDLKEHPVVFCRNIFAKPKQTALSISMDCEPYLFGLGESHHLGSRCKSLVRVLDIKNRFTADDVLNVMLLKQNDIGREKLTEEELELYTKLIKVLVKCMDRQNIDYNDIRTSMTDEGVSTRLCIPDINGVLAPIDVLCLNDNEKIGTTGTMQFVNGKIGPDFARKLGVKAKIKQHFSDHTRKIPFGQKEELTTRIRELLRGYPCDEGIMKELLQNADDAQATELQFIIDDRTYSAEKVFDDKWKTLQGPALLVYNNSMFSAKDIQGIQDLGIGSKGEDTTQTGQYGVGFNAVYHLTDVPSFLTKGPDVEGGETMCIMDPHCQFLSEATEERPGIQLVNLHEHRDLYPDVFKCYHEDKILTDKGTVFRFPLRTKDETKKHSADPQRTKDERRKPLAEPMSSEKLRNLLKTFEKELLESLLFVNSVKKITLSDISSGECRTQYEVETVISQEDEEKRTTFGNHVREISRKFRDLQDISSLQNVSVSYNVTVKDNKGVSNTWLVVQHIGFGDGDIPTEVLDAYKHRNLRLLPRGGVAILLSSHKSSERHTEKQNHKAFCFLPLPLRTGLPVHVNGHFALGGATRSALWSEERGTYKWQWNKLLLSRVIPSAYIMGMERIKEMLLTDVDESRLVKKTRQLDDLFPIFKDAKDCNWKILAKEVLNQIYSDHHELFYMDMSHGSSVGALPLFVPLKQQKEQFPAVFNTLKNHKRSNVTQLTWQDRQQLEVIMKGIGLRLLDSPTTVFDSMKLAGVPVSEVSPTVILEFMKSFNRIDIEHRCNIVIRENGKDLSDTSLQNQVKVFALLQYCRDSEEFASGIIDVPMCLTEDGKLRVFNESCEIFCSELFDILPGSGNRFLHRSLLCLCDIKELQGKVFKPFDIPSFAELLEESLSPQEFRNPVKMVDWLLKNGHIPNTSWICKVWKFLAKQLKKSRGNDEANVPCPDEREAVQTIPQDLIVVAPWNLVPCTLNHQGQQGTRTVLSSLSAFDKVLNLESFTGQLKNALGKLALPIFDTNALHTPILSSLIPYDKKPAMVLNCLHFHCKERGYQHLSNKDADAILEYFVDHVKEVQKLDDWEIKLKSLPLYRTVHGEHVSLEIELKVLVFPAYIPTNGIKEWGQASSTLLLKQHPKLKSLYEAFEYTESSKCDVYTSHILAKVECLPRDCIPVHFEFIRKNLLTYEDEDDPEQRNLIGSLQGLCIFGTERGGLKRASELHSPHVPIFQAMRRLVHFPVAPYAEYEWQRFMELIGMVKQASNELILKFARAIEEEGRHTMTDEVLKKSNLLLGYIWDIDKIESSDLLSNIRKIKFIKSLQISREQQTIFPQYEAGQFIAFEGAVSCRYVKYVWSNCNILPNYADPMHRFYDKKARLVARKLQMCPEKPPLEKVIQHTQNICDALKEQCERNVWRKEDTNLKSLMSDIYEYLWKHAAKQSILCERLRQKHIVYLPSENTFVTCGVLVIHLEEFGEIKPYLYSAPTVFGRNFELFEKLGTEKRPTCTTYARVLEQITQDVRDQKLNANERQSVRKAINGLFSHLQKDTDVNLQVPFLYLPTEDFKLMDSTKMIYSNNRYCYDAIGKQTGLTYFIGFEYFDLSFFDCDIERLPLKFRPLILTEIVEKKIDVTNLDVTQGHHTNHLQEFIQRPEFVEGLLRILHHDKLTGARPDTDKVLESNVVSALQKIKVLQVNDFAVNYVYKEKVVGCNTDVFSHIQKEENGQQGLVWNLYTKFPEGMERTDWLVYIEKKLVHLISESTNIDCFRHRSVILKFLVQMDHPERISYILDNEDYRDYHISESLLEKCLPVCGTYVHEKWHHMLDNTTYTFDQGEFVALQLHDAKSLDADKSTAEIDIYIFARVVKLIGSDIEGELSLELTQYEVYVGENRRLIKFAYEIYKILRKKTDSRELVHAVDVANDRPANTMHLQVIFREVRRKLLAIWTLSERQRKIIFKRYLRQWHPDKNIGNEEQATDVFKYIQFVWDRLTNGDPVNVDDDVDPSDYSHTQPSTNSDFYDKIYRQCSREKQWYQESSGSSGGYRRSHYHASDPVPNPIQQRKWFKQAELDLAAAEHFMESAEEVQGYNWICYMSHQAVEKSLKSMVYGTDVNSVNRGHDICEIAASLEDDFLMNAAGEMQVLLGHHTHMRYPDIHAAGRIPSTFFTRTHAESALRKARKILDEVNAKN